MAAGPPVTVNRALFLGGLAVILSGCAHESRIERAYDGHVVDGRYIAPQAYAAFLRGTIASTQGDAKGALDAFDEAARLDPSSAEVWTRMGDARCRANVRDGHADEDFARALAIDATYSRAWAAKAKCALARGDVAGARAAAEQASRTDPTADSANVLLARTAPGDPTTRDSLVALTITASDQATAWDALATWAKAAGDVALWARALVELARVAPARRDEIAGAAEELAGAGETWEAREVAAAAAQDDERPLSGAHPLAGRLALDEAIARGAPSAVSPRATRVRLPLDEAAGRALLAGDCSLAHAVASEASSADPAARGARLVAAASGEGDLLVAIHHVSPADADVSAAAFVAFGVALAHTTSPEQSRAVLSALRHRPILGGDDRVIRPAVLLAWRGSFPADALPPDGVVELAALRGEGLPEALIADGQRVLDARHEYLALAIARPASARARVLAGRLRGSTDSVVSAASALILLATDGAIAPDAPRTMLFRDGSDPLLAVAALRLAKKSGDEQTVRRAGEALKAMGAGSRAED